MEIQIIHDKSRIWEFLKTNPELQVYCIGDLDDFFWPKTIWYALVDKSSICAIALLYIGMETLTLLAFYESKPDYTYELLTRIKSYLPNKFYAHLSPSLIKVFGENNIIHYYGRHHKMALRRKPTVVSDNNIRRLSVSDIPVIADFYAFAYPQNWFDKRMIETGKYFGYFTDNKLAGVAGIHVYSSEYRVAALGNIATHPDYRNRQIGFKLTSVLCANLSETADAIGLNVKADNEYALKCYKKIGFESIGEFDEYCLKNT